MNMQARLENLRSKPEHVRRRIAFWSSAGISGLIFVFWLGSFTAAGSAVKGSIAEAVSKAESPAQSLVASVGSFFGDIKDLIWSPKKVEYGNVEVLPGKR